MSNTSASERFAAAVHLWNSGDHARAERMFASVLELAPNHAGTHLNIGLVHLAGGRPASAEEWLRKALALDEGMIEARLNLANIFLGGGRLLQALEMLAGLDPEGRASPLAAPLLRDAAGKGLAEAERLAKAEDFKAAAKLTSRLFGFGAHKDSLLRLAAYLSRRLPLAEAALLIEAAGSTASSEQTRDIWLVFADGRWGEGDIGQALEGLRRAHGRQAVPAMPVELINGGDILEHAGTRHAEVFTDFPFSYVRMGSAENSSYRPFVAALDDAAVLGDSFIPLSADKFFSSQLIHNAGKLATHRASLFFDNVLLGREDRILVNAERREKCGKEAVLIGQHGNFGHWLLNHFALNLPPN